MKIAVCGSGTKDNTALNEKAAIIGAEIAKNKHTVLTGGCWGLPYAAARGAIEHKGKVIFMSPGKNEKDHLENYMFPEEKQAEMVYTGNGIPGRNLDLINACDAAIILEGQIGTLNEFTLAVALNKKVGALAHTKLSEHLQDLFDLCDKKQGAELIVHSDPSSLVKQILS